MTSAPQHNPSHSQIMLNADQPADFSFQMGNVGLLLGSCWLQEMTLASLSALQQPAVKQACQAIG